MREHQQAIGNYSNNRIGSKYAAGGAGGKERHTKKRPAVSTDSLLEERVLELQVPLALPDAGKQIVPYSCCAFSRVRVGMVNVQVQNRFSGGL